MSVIQQREHRKQEYKRYDKQTWVMWHCVCHRTGNDNLCLLRAPRWQIIEAFQASCRGNQDMIMLLWREIERERASEKEREGERERGERERERERVWCCVQGQSSRGKWIYGIIFTIVLILHLLLANTSVEHQPPSLHTHGSPSLRTGGEYYLTKCEWWCWNYHNYIISIWRFW